MHALQQSRRVDTFRNNITAQQSFTYLWWT